MEPVHLVLCSSVSAMVARTRRRGWRRRVADRDARVAHVGREHLGVHGGHRAVGQAQADRQDEQRHAVQHDVPGVDQEEHRDHPGEDEAVADQEGPDAADPVREPAADQGEDQPTEGGERGGQQDRGVGIFSVLVA